MSHSRTPNSIEDLIRLAASLAHYGDDCFIRGHDDYKIYWTNQMNIRPAAFATLTKVSFHDYSFKLTQINSTMFPSSYHCRQTDFDRIGACRIADSHFVAVAGPDKPRHVELLLRETLFGKKSIKNFVLLVNGMHRNREGTMDCWDYCVTPNKLSETRQYGACTVTVKQKNGEIRLNQSSEVIFQHDIIQTEMTVTLIGEEKDKALTKTANATVLNVKDTCPLYLRMESEMPFYRDNEVDLQRKKNLWEIYQTSRTDDTLVHCKAGWGRTGHFILMMRLLDVFLKPDFFVRASARKILQQALAEVNEMRQHRRGLVATIDQFQRAMINAFALFQYALKYQLVDVSKYQHILTAVLPEQVIKSFLLLRQPSECKEFKTVSYTLEQAKTEIRNQLRLYYQNRPWGINPFGLISRQNVAVKQYKTAFNSAESFSDIKKLLERLDREIHQLENQYKPKGNYTVWDEHSAALRMKKNSLIQTRYKTGEAIFVYQNNRLAVTLDTIFSWANTNRWLCKTVAKETKNKKIAFKKTMTLLTDMMKKTVEAADEVKVTSESKESARVLISTLFVSDAPLVTPQSTESQTGFSYGKLQ